MSSNEWQTTWYNRTTRKNCTRGAPIGKTLRKPLGTLYTLVKRGVNNKTPRRLDTARRRRGTRAQPGTGSGTALCPAPCSVVLFAVVSPATDELETSYMKRLRNQKVTNRGEDINNVLQSHPVYNYCQRNEHTRTTSSWRAVHRYWTIDSKLRLRTMHLKMLVAKNVSLERRVKEEDSHAKVRKFSENVRKPAQTSWNVQQSRDSRGSYQDFLVLKSPIPFPTKVTELSR